MPFPKISFCLICRDNEKTIKATLDSIKDIAAEIIVVDTGSKDKTCEIVKEYSDKLYHFKWIDDFAAARNESIRHAKEDWIFIIDTDEILAEDPAPKIQKTIDSGNSNAYFIQIRNIYENNKTRDIYYMARLFKNNIVNDPYRGRVHERLKPDFKHFYSDITLTHRGYHDIAGLEHKDQKYRHKLIEKDYQENPDDVNAFSNLLTILIDLNKYQEALDLLEKNNKFDKHVEIILKKAKALESLGRTKEAAETLQPILKEKNNTSLDLRPYLMYGQLLCKQKKLAKAHKLYTNTFVFTPEDIYKQTLPLFLFDSYYLSLIQACYLALDFKEPEKCLKYSTWLIDNDYHKDQALPLMLYAAYELKNSKKVIELYKKYQEFFTNHRNADYFNKLYLLSKKNQKKV